MEEKLTDKIVEKIDNEIWDALPKEPLDRILRIENTLGYGEAKSQFTHIEHTSFKERLEKERDKLKQEILSWRETQVCDTCHGKGYVYGK